MPITGENIWSASESWVKVITQTCFKRGKRKKKKKVEIKILKDIPVVFAINHSNTTLSRRYIIILCTRREKEFIDKILHRSSKESCSASRPRCYTLPPTHPVHRQHRRPHTRCSPTRRVIALILNINYNIHTRAREKQGEMESRLPRHRGEYLKTVRNLYTLRIRRLRDPRALGFIASHIKYRIIIYVITSYTLIPDHVGRMDMYIGVTCACR